VITYDYTILFSTQMRNDACQLDANFLRHGYYPITIIHRRNSPTNYIQDTSIDFRIRKNLKYDIRIPFVSRENEATVQHD